MAKVRFLSLSFFYLLFALGCGLRMQGRRRRQSETEANSQVSPNIPLLFVFILHGGRVRHLSPNLLHCMR